MSGEILAIIPCLSDEISGGPVMRALWMALLCAVFVNLFPLPVDAGCSDCEIELFRPTLEPPLECVQIYFHLLENCGCSIWIDLENECSDELKVYTDISYFSENCWRGSDKCDLLMNGQSTYINIGLLNYPSEELIYLKRADVIHVLSFETDANSVNNNNYGIGCGGMTAPHENSSNFEGFLILTVIFIVASVRRKISG